MKRTWSAWTGVALTVAALVATPACSGTPDRAGGSTVDKAVVLTLAQSNGEPPAQLVAWADRVKTRSKGTVRIEFSNGWRLGETRYEADTVADVKAGKVDMAWVGARAMDRVGVTAFQPLLAPMLVDSYALERKVFEAGIPAQMATSVDAAGVVGVGVLPGPMRKVLGLAKPFLTAADFDGTAVADQDSALAQQTLSALGATAVPVPSGAKLENVDAYEQQLASIAGNHYARVAKYVTANVNLWPRPLLVIMGKSAWTKLSTSQQEALRAAATGDAVAASLDASVAEDAEAVTAICRAGMHLVEASPTQLGSLRTALAPVYTHLGSNEQAGRWLAAIQALKSQTQAPAESGSCGSTAGTTVTSINGTYEKKAHTAADWKAACKDDVPPGLPPDDQVDTNTVVFANGKVTQYGQTPGASREIGWQGTYKVFKDTLELTADGEGGRMSMTWSLEGSTLTLSNLHNSEDCGDEAVWTLHPWTRVG